MDLLEYLSIITGSIFEGQFLCRIVRTSLFRVAKPSRLGPLPQALGRAVVYPAGTDFVS